MWCLVSRRRVRQSRYLTAWSKTAGLWSRFTHSGTQPQKKKMQLRLKCVLKGKQTSCLCLGLSCKAGALRGAARTIRSVMEHRPKCFLSLIRLITRSYVTKLDSFCNGNPRPIQTPGPWSPRLWGPKPQKPNTWRASTSFLVAFPLKQTGGKNLLLSKWKINPTNEIWPWPQCPHTLYIPPARNVSGTFTDCPTLQKLYTLNSDVLVFIATHPAFRQIHM